MPLAKSYFAIVATTRDARRAALLLTTAQTIRKGVVSIYVIHLRGRLVVPTAPRLPAVDSDDCALVAAEQNNVRVIGIDPDVLIVVAARSTAKARPCLSTID